MTKFTWLIWKLESEIHKHKKTTKPIDQVLQNEKCWNQYKQKNVVEIIFWLTHSMCMISKGAYLPFFPKWNAKKKRCNLMK